MSNQVAAPPRFNSDHPLWQGHGSLWKGIKQFAWAIIRVWLAQQLWGTAVRLAHFPLPTKNLGLVVAIAALFLFGWGVWGIWQAFNTLGAKRFLGAILAIYLLLVVVNVLTVPDERGVFGRAISQAGNTATSMGLSAVTAVQNLLAAPDEFLFAYTGRRAMPDLPPGFPTPDPEATSVNMVSAAGSQPQRSLRPTPTATTAAVRLRETAVSPAPPTSGSDASTRPAATPLPPAVPKDLTIGEYAIVVNTGSQSLIVRSDPGTEHEIVTRYPEGSRLLILEGPLVEGEFAWWKVQGESGEGWCADRWLQPDDN